jgi:hypothetical protein
MFSLFLIISCVVIVYSMMYEYWNEHYEDFTEQKEDENK